MFKIITVCLFGALATSCAAPADDAPSSPAGTSTTVAAASPFQGTILFLGDSITAGNGLDPELAFPAVIDRRLDSLGYVYEVVNAGLSGETTAGGLRRIDWLLKQPIDILVIELGGNDGLRGIPAEVAESNLRGMIAKARETDPTMQIVLGGMQAPANMGGPYGRSFQEIYPRLAKETGVVLIPFILDGVAGVPELNQADRIHPTAQGQRLIAEIVWKHLEPLLKAEDATS